jgi:hypothetical protein
MNAVRRVIRPTHKTASDESKAKSEKENKEKVQIISAETEALIEKNCPHANATASGRKSGLTQERESRGHEPAESKEERREERESFDSGGWEAEQGAEADGSQDRTDKEERATKGKR